MKHRLILPLLLLGLMASASYALPDSTRAWNIGLSLGSLMGSGISYRYWFPGQTAIQFAAFPYAKWEGNEYDLILDVGGTVQKVFHEGDRIRLMVYGGGTYYVNYKRDSLGVTTTDKKQVKVGLGPAIEYPMRNFTYTIGTGFSFKTDLKEEKSMSFVLDIGVHYAFGEVRK